VYLDCLKITKERISLAKPRSGENRTLNKELDIVKEKIDNLK
jgi:hypothetical protein